MALTVTPANVKASDSAPKLQVKYGAAVTAGQVLYKATDGTYSPARANAVATSVAAGIALLSGSTGQWGLMVIQDDSFDPGATTVQGTVYAVADDVAGGIEAAEDLAQSASIETPVQAFGIGLADNKMKIDFNAKITGSLAVSE